MCLGAQVPAAQPFLGVPARSGSRIAELDGLRGFACLMILVVHHVPAAWLPIPALWNTGVDLFFVLSGYLLGGICLDQRGASNYFSAFYARRAFRIFPIYFAWLAVYFALTANVLWEQVRVPAWPYFFYLQNYYVVWHGDIGLGPGFLGPTWSLAIEEQFYLLLPMLIWIVPLRLLPVVLLALVGSAWVSRVWVSWYSDTALLTNYVLTTSRWDAPFIGVLGAWAVRRWGVPPRWCLLTALILCGFLVSPVWTLEKSGLVAHVKPTVLALCYLVILLLTIRSSMLSRLMRVRAMVFLGTISYGTYLYQTGILEVVRLGARGTDLHEGWLNCISLATTLTFAWLSYRYYESPLIKIGHRWKYALASSHSEAADPCPEPVGGSPRAPHTERPVSCQH